MAELAQQVLDGDRRALARAITLVESTRADHRPEADALLDALLPATGDAPYGSASAARPASASRPSSRPSGSRSSKRGHRLAVLAVDPSSRRSGGSILGDKTRMTELAKEPDVFIRPSPGGTQLGGVARRTREAMLLCEAAGFDVVFVETIGVGQSEVAVADMVDLFLLLVPPGGGDELQGIKRGIMELADVVVVNKADGDLAAAAGRTAADYRNAAAPAATEVAQRGRPRSSPARRSNSAASPRSGTRSSGSSTRSARPASWPSCAAAKRSPGSGRSCRMVCSISCGPTPRCNVCSPPSRHDVVTGADPAQRGRPQGVGVVPPSGARVRSPSHRVSG